MMTPINMLARNLRYSSRRFYHIDFKDLPDHRGLYIENYGDPVKDVILKTNKPEDILPKELGPKQILVEHLAACINPADINLIQGVYGIRPKLPTILGNEGVVRVKSVGSDVQNVKPGNLALGVSTLGYWQNYSIQNCDDFYEVDNGLASSTACQLKVNPCTAFRMLQDFYKLSAGDTVIQNAANSAVGIYVIQLCKLLGYNTINVIRDRPNKEELIEELNNYGADVVLTENEISNVELMVPLLKKIGKPKLFLDAVAGKNTPSYHKALDEGGHHVVYGAMSRQPLISPVSPFIFKDHKMFGFWVSRWYKRSERKDIQAMFDQIGDLFKRGVLRPKPTTLIDFEDRNVAFEGSSKTKYIFAMNKYDR